MDYVIQAITAYKEPSQLPLLMASQAPFAQLVVSASSVLSDQRTAHLASTIHPPESPVPLTVSTVLQAPTAAAPTILQLQASALLGIIALLDLICQIKTHHHQALIHQREHLHLLNVLQEPITPTLHKLNV